MSKKLKTSIFVFFIVVAGFIRETLFVRITWYYAVATGAADPPPGNWLFSFLQSCSAEQLMNLKYIFTLVFMLVFMGLSLLLVKWFFHQPSNYKLVFYVFAGLFIVAAFLFLCGYVFPAREQWYAFSRWTMGVIETPLCIILLYPVFWLKRQSDQ